MILRNGVVAWVIIPSKYVREAAKNFEKHVKDKFPDKNTLPSRAGNSFVMGYETVMDTLKALDPAEEFYFNPLLALCAGWLKLVRLIL